MLDIWVLIPYIYELVFMNIIYCMLFLIDFRREDDESEG